MSENHADTSVEFDTEIRLERVNTDKTRLDIGSVTAYHVYFELSGHPPPEWRIIFERERKAMNPTYEADIDGSFLVLHCQLHEVAATALPALKRVVAVTNEAYKRYVQNEASALQQRQDVWKQERKDVDAMSKSLHFD
jgi:hypothetical protein